jgi:hypothetical protein
MRHFFLREAIQHTRDNATILGRRKVDDDGDAVRGGVDGGTSKGGESNGDMGEREEGEAGATGSKGGREKDDGCEMIQIILSVYLSKGERII